MKHNPDNLTDEKIEAAEGWRLIDEDEVTFEGFAGNNAIESWFSDERRWMRNMNGDSITLTYRTKLSRSELRAARGLPPEEDKSEVEEIRDAEFTISFIESFNAMSRLAHANARDKGFWDTSDKLQQLANAHGLGKELSLMRGAQLNALIASEIGEALEGARKDLPSDKCPGFTNEEEEYADAVVRILDLAEGRKLRIADAIIAKMRYNSSRERLHGGKSY